MKARILFLCAKGSSRSMLAASLLLAQAAQRWEVFSTPTLDEQTVAGWNQHPTSFVWEGKRKQRGERAKLRQLAGSDAAISVSDLIAAWPISVTSCSILL